MQHQYLVALTSIETLALSFSGVIFFFVAVPVHKGLPSDLSHYLFFLTSWAGLPLALLWPHGDPDHAFLATPRSSGPRLSP